MKIRRITVGGVQRRLQDESSRLRRRFAETVDPDSLRDDSPFAAGYSNWLKRRELRVGSDLAAAIAQSRGAVESTSRIAVVFNARSQAGVDAFAELLRAMPTQFDLFITSTASADLSIEDRGISRLNRVEIYRFSDQGRDLLPTITLVNAGVLERYDLVFKAVEGDDVSGIFDSAGSIMSALSQFEADPAVGALVPHGQRAGADRYSASAPITTSLLRRLQMWSQQETISFPATGTFWARSFVLNGLRAFEMSEWDFEIEIGQVDGTTAFGVRRLLGALIAESGYEVREASNSGIGEIDSAESPGWKHYEPTAARTPRARLVAAYSVGVASKRTPTSRSGSWTDVVSARPSMRGQIQPLLPSELGFYDISDAEVRRRQRELATAAGIEGFVFGCRWDSTGFDDASVLEDHLSRTESGPYAIHWLGPDSFLDSAESPNNAAGYIRALSPYLSDSRYLRINGKPLVVVSGLNRIPSLDSVIEEWRADAAAVGLPGISIIAVSDDSWSETTRSELLRKGVDSAVVQPEHKIFLGRSRIESPEVSPFFRGEIRDYGLVAETAERVLSEDTSDSYFPAVLVNQDDTPTKRLRADVMLGANPFTFRRWLNSAVGAVAAREPQHRLVVVDSWNSWLTSAVLEPSDRFGTTYLAAVCDVLRR